MDHILVVEDTESLRVVLGKVLEQEGYTVSTTPSAEEALSMMRETDFTMVLSDLKLPKQSGLDLLGQARELPRRVPIVVMTAYGNVDIAVHAMKLGATDFITKPFEPKALCHLIRQIVDHRRIIDRSLGSSSRRQRSFLTQTKSAEDVLRQAAKVAALSSPVLILGESGTGKELIARMIHEKSTRASAPFVAVNCASMPSELLESEFFGHEAGAFTGATEQRIGLFEVADHGTIFLDEIGTMPASLQTKLLRTLQESEIKRLGSTKLRKINSRVISATNSNLENEIKHGNFREDLFYRLGVIILEVPALRKRPDDIPLLINYFVKTISQEFGKEPPAISSAAMQKLQAYHWPGNVRQLENAIERALILTEGTLVPESFELSDLLNPEAIETITTLPLAVSGAVRKTEIELISKVLQRTGGNKSRAAEILGVSYKTLLNKVKEYQLDVDDSLTGVP